MNNLRKISKKKKILVKKQKRDNSDLRDEGVIKPKPQEKSKLMKSNSRKVLGANTLNKLNSSSLKVQEDLNNTVDCINLKRNNGKRVRKLTRPNTSLNNYQSKGAEKSKILKRDKSENMIGIKNSKLHTIEEYRRARKKRNSSLSGSFNQTSLNALEALKTKRFGLDS